MAQNQKKVFTAIFLFIFLFLNNCASQGRNLKMENPIITNIKVIMPVKDVKYYEYLTAALIFFETGKYNYAMYNFYKASELNNKKKDPYFFLGAIYLHIEDNASAYIMFTEGCRLNDLNSCDLLDKLKEIKFDF